MSPDFKILKEEYASAIAPEGGKQKVVEAMERAEKKKNKIRKIRIRCIAAAAVIGIIILLPNTNASIAMAMGNIPVIGQFFKVITWKNYEYEDKNNHANVEVPLIAEVTEAEKKESSLEGAKAVNKSVEEYTDMLVKKFNEDMDASGDGHKSLDVTYDVITDTDDWFTLKMNTLEIQASGYQHYKFYHINKKTGEVATLKDLFKDGSNYVNAISEEVKAQMREQMAADENMMYFLESEDMPEFDFKEIAVDQNFYFNDSGEIIIVFDEYAVAPGYMGCPEFEISKKVLSDILK